MIIHIKDLIPDSKNANLHSPRGSSMVQKSLQKYGAGRSILLDKNNNIIAGNLTTEEAGQRFIPRLRYNNGSSPELRA